MAKTLVCIHFSRTVLAIMILLFILVSVLKLFGFPYMPSPDYSPVVFVLLDLVLVVGLIAAATQHLKTLIVFGWLIALTFLLIFFGNTVSSQYQSDLWGKYLHNSLFLLYCSITTAISLHLKTDIGELGFKGEKEALFNYQGIIKESFVNELLSFTNQTSFAWLKIFNGST